MFLLADEGYPGYAGMVLAPNSLIASNPAAVKAFVEASAAGWQAYLHGDPAPGDELILKDNPEMTEDVLGQARDKMRAYGIVDSGDAKTLGIGAMTDARWTSLLRHGLRQGRLSQDPGLQERLHPAVPAGAEVGVAGAPLDR